MLVMLSGFSVNCVPGGAVTFIYAVFENTFVQPVDRLVAVSVTVVVAAIGVVGAL